MQTEGPKKSITGLIWQLMPYSAFDPLRTKEAPPECTLRNNCMPSGVLFMCGDEVTD